MVPWGTLLENPSVAVMVPFVWLLWQIYLPHLLNTIAGKDPADGFVYETWFTQVKDEFKTEFDRVDNRVDSMGSNIRHIADTQEKLVRVTIAQSHMLNGYDGDIDVDEVEDDLRENKAPRPSDYLDDEYDPYDTSDRQRGDV